MLEVLRENIPGKGDLIVDDEARFILQVERYKELLSIGVDHAPLKSAASFTNSGNSVIRWLCENGRTKIILPNLPGSKKSTDSIGDLQQASTTSRERLEHRSKL